MGVTSSTGNAYTIGVSACIPMISGVHVGQSLVFHVGFYEQLYVLCLIGIILSVLLPFCLRLYDRWYKYEMHNIMSQWTLALDRSSNFAKKPGIYSFISLGLWNASCTFLQSINIKTLIFSLLLFYQRSSELL